MPRFVDPMLRTPEVGAADLEKPVTEMFGDFDAKRASGLALLSRVQTARQLVLTAQRGRIAGREGEDSPGVRAIDAELAASRAASSQLSLHITRATTPVATASQDEWILYGNVHASDGSLAAGLRVGVFAGAREIAYAITDANGRYVARAPIEAARVEAEVEAAARAPLDVRVTDASGAVVAEPPDKFVARAGHADYLEIMVPGGSVAPPVPPSPPPPDTRGRAPGRRTSEKGGRKR